jgi:hypothetical protein
VSPRRRGGGGESREGRSRPRRRSRRSRRPVADVDVVIDDYEDPQSGEECQSADYGCANELGAAVLTGGLASPSVKDTLEVRPSLLEVDGQYRQNHDKNSTDLDDQTAYSR